MNTETDPDAFRVDVAEGKYSVLHDGKGKMTALRYGEPWGRDLVGDNLVFHLAAELHETRTSLATIRATSAKGMTITVLVTGLIEAYVKDEAPAIGGFDISGGMLGPNLSDWIRSVAGQFDKLHGPPEPAILDDIKPLIAALSAITDTDDWQNVAKALVATHRFIELHPEATP